MLKQDSYLLLYIKEAIGFAQVRRICRLRAAGAKGIFSFAKENIPFGTPRERLDIAGEQLEELQCLPIALPCARRCRVRTARRFASASIIRCRSADLVEVQTNFRLPRHSSMRRAPAMPHSARSLPPFYRHSRLTIVRRGCWMCRIAGIHGEAMYTALTLRSACSSSSLKLPMQTPFFWTVTPPVFFPRKENGGCGLAARTPHKPARPGARKKLPLTGKVRNT